MLSHMPVLSNKAIENSLLIIKLTIIYYTRELTILQQLLYRFRIEVNKGLSRVNTFVIIQFDEIHD